MYVAANVAILYLSMRSFTLLLFSCISFLFLAGETSAATLYMSPTTIELNRGDSTVISVRLDVNGGECVNVVDGVVQYSNNIEPVDISRGESILSVWVEDPVIDRTKRTISFAGGVPNGYCGRIAGDPRLTNNILNIVVASPGFVIGGSGSSNATQTAAINFTDATQVLLNDGSGSRADLTTYGAEIELNPKAGQGIENEWQERILADTIPPNAFSINLERTENAFSNRYFITFNTTDKQTGIDHYEIMEEPLDQLLLFNWGREDAPWVDARSPYLLRDQSLNSTIRVRAIDKAGNEYVAALIPDESQRTMDTETIILVSLLGLVGVGLVAGVAFAVVKVLRARRRRKDTNETEQEDDYYEEDEEVEEELEEYDYEE